MIVLDTNVVSESLRPQPAPEVVEWIASTEADGLLITSITADEVLSGVEKMPSGRRRAELEAGVEELLDTYAERVLDFDLPAARIHARMWAARRSAGRPLPLADGMIASLCRREEASLATRNVRDFEGLGIRLVNPWEPR